jgi:hypothetical protein
MINLSLDSIDAWRIYTIKLRLELLAAERESSICNSVPRVNTARRHAVEDIATICAPSWKPDIDALMPALIDTIDRP